MLQGKTASLQGGLQPKGTALAFDGTDDYIDLGSDLLATDGAHTVLAVATLRAFNGNYPVLFNYLTTGNGGRRKLFFAKKSATGYADITFGLHGNSGTGTAGWSLTPGEASGGSKVLNVEHSMVIRCAGITTAAYEMWRNGQHLSRAGLSQATNTQTGLNCVGRSSTNEATNYLDGRVSLLVVFNAILPFADCAELSKNPWSIFQSPTRRIFLPASGGASSGPVGLSTEVDAAFALSARQYQTVGLSAETDTSLALGSGASQAVGLCVETDICLALVGRQYREVGLSAETDSSITLAGKHSRATGLSAETDTAFALASNSGTVVGLSVETDTAFALAARQYQTVGLSAEVDTSFALASNNGGTVGLSTETDTCFALAGRAYRNTGLSLEIDTSFALAAVVSRQVGLSVEVNTSFTLQSVSSRAAGMSVETDSALALASGGVQVTVKAGSWLRYRTI